MVEQYDKSLILHSNFSFSRDHQFCRMPPFYLEILQIWSEATSQTPTCFEQMLSQSLWFHNSIFIDKKPVYFPIMSQFGFNKVKGLFDQSGKPFTQARIQEMEAPPDVCFKYMQLLHAIPNTRRSHIRNSSFTYTEIPESCVLTTCDKQYSLEQLTSKLIYDILIVKLFVQPTSTDYWKNTLRLKDELDWKEVFMIPRLATIESSMRVFQYKLLNNALYLNAKLYKMKIIKSPLCTFCHEHDETPVHFFVECPVTTMLWSQYKEWLRGYITLATLTPQSALIGFLKDVCRGDYALTNHILLIFKRAIYELRLSKAKPSIYFIKQKLKSIYKIEAQIAEASSKLDRLYKKWKNADFMTC